MSDYNFTDAAASNLYSPTREIVGTPEDFLRLFSNAAGHYGKVRITYDVVGGVRIEFTGHWTDNCRVWDATQPLTPDERDRLDNFRLGYLGRFWRWCRKILRRAAPSVSEGTPDQ